ncbi:MAG: argininosuccinate lyase [Bacteroidetes bacterium]|nr:argininosuccinate lyase [Bacteroidota bacterium]
MKKLWSKTQGEESDISRLIHEFTAGEDRHWDLRLAEFDIRGSIAHVNMLAKTGLISEEDRRVLLPEMEALLEKVKAGEFSIEEGMEDVHSQVEFLLTEKLGESGKKIHAARSRNDQVLVDMKLYLKSELLAIHQMVQEFATLLLELSEKNKEVLLPGYTHYQVAMPSSFGLWFASWSECLAEDLWNVHAAVKLIDKNPLGSAAGYGSSFPIDREMTTKELGFSDLHWNVVNAQMSRGRSEKAMAVAMSALAFTLGKMSQDMVLYLSQNFAFVRFPDTYTTGSSIMPHKKNPDVFELIRARCNRLINLPNQLSLIQANLSSGYHRDWQLFKEALFPAIDDIKACFQMATEMMKAIEVQDNLTGNELYRYLFTVEAVNQKVLDGFSFREAYREVGMDVEAGKFEWNEALNHTHQGSIGNLRNEEIVRQLREVRDAIGQIQNLESLGPEGPSDILSRSK